MKVALIGYGKMGKVVHETLEKRGHTIGFIHNSMNAFASDPDFLSCDLAIEFTQPESAVSTIKACILAGMPVVSGTTGWLKEWDEIQSLVNQHDGSLFYASNYSPGIYILRKLTEEAAKILNQFPDYSILLKEVHHQHKKDKPSGTSITLAEDFLGQSTRFQDWKLNTEPLQSELAVEALREGEVFGDHQWIFESEFDTIQISHSANNRKGFALGAVMAAEFLLGKKGIFGTNNLWDLK